MAEGGNGPWRCDTCDVRFTYKSKLDRHVTTAKHKALEACWSELVHWMNNHTVTWRTCMLKLCNQMLLM